jgi:hypothetical protein
MTLSFLFWSLVVAAFLNIIAESNERHRQRKAWADHLQAQAERRHWDAVFARIEGRGAPADEGGAAP